MNIKKFVAIGTAVVAVSALALDYVEVTGVKARQRYPWNGLVDIDFTLDSKATEQYLMNVVAYDNVGKTNLPVRSVFTENISYSNNPCMVSKDATRIVWDASADLPNGFKCSNVLVTCQDTRTIKQDKLYCVIDISAGTNATAYSVSYLDSVPEGGWSDEYKTKKIVLRRIDAGSFMMGSPESEIGRVSNEDYHRVTISKSFYISVFEITEHQYDLVVGGTSLSIKPKFCSYTTIRGNDLSSEFRWPDSEAVYSKSFVGRLRIKTDINSFDLPTEAQWEFASKGGCVTALNNGTSCTTENVNAVGRNKNNRTDSKGDASLTTTTYVGLYMPNALGIYDMLGNAAEWCRDAYQKKLGTTEVCDPKGGAATISEYKTWILRVIKGGGVVGGCPIWWNGNYCGLMSSSATHSAGEYNNGFLPYTACRSAARAASITSINTNYIDSERGDEAHLVTCGFRVVFETE